MIKIGDRFPTSTVRKVTSDGPKAHTTSELFGNRRVIVFGLPGAFTPTCHKTHLPGFIDRAEAFKAEKGVEEIFVVATNDAFVMSAWKKISDENEKITYLADGNAELPKLLGLEMDGTANGMGLRLRRFSMLIENGIVTRLNVEDSPGKADLSGAGTLFDQI
jgi:glutaredoxin/glutathione-dependent peroxiredoxin